MSTWNMGLIAEPSKIVELFCGLVGSDRKGALSFPFVSCKKVSGTAPSEVLQDDRRVTFALI